MRNGWLGSPLSADGAGALQVTECPAVAQNWPRTRRKWAGNPSFRSIEHGGFFFSR